MTAEAAYSLGICYTKSCLTLVPLILPVYQSDQNDLGIKDQFRHMRYPIEIDIGRRVKNVVPVERFPASTLVWRYRGR